MWYDRLNKGSLGGWMFAIGGLVALCLVIPSCTALLGLAVVAAVVLMVVFFSAALIFSAIEMLLPRMARGEASTGFRRELA